MLREKDGKTTYYVYGIGLIIDTGIFGTTSGVLSMFPVKELRIKGATYGNGSFAHVAKTQLTMVRKYGRKWSFKTLMKAVTAYTAIDFNATILDGILNGTGKSIQNKLEGEK